LQKFIAKYESQIAGVLSGFDRLVFRGSLRKISYVFGLQGYLWAQDVLLKDFGSHVQQVSQQVKQAALQCMQTCGRPVQYLYSSLINKEETARAIAEKDGIAQGPVCALTCVELRRKKTAAARQLSVVSCAYYGPITSSARFPPVIAINLRPWGARSSLRFLQPAMLPSSPSSPRPLRKFFADWRESDC
jgi:hypothetical protein